MNVTIPYTDIAKAIDTYVEVKHHASGTEKSFLSKAKAKTTEGLIKSIKISGSAPNRLNISAGSLVSISLTIESVNGNDIAIGCDNSKSLSWLLGKVGGILGDALCAGNANRLIVRLGSISKLQPILAYAKLQSITTDDQGISLAIVPTK